MSKPKSKYEQIKALKADMDMQYLLNEAYRILGNPVLIHDMEFKLVAHTENIVTDDPIWNEFTTTGTVGRERLEFYKNENFLDTMANAKNISFLSSDKLKYERIVKKLLNCDNIQIGVAAIEGHQPFSDDTLELFELFCGIINKKISKSEYFRDYGQQYQEILINKLIDRNIEDKGIYTAHVESIYMNLKDHLYLAVADIPPCDSMHAQLVYFRDLFKRTQPAFKYSIYANYIVIIMSFDSRMPDIKAGLNKFATFFKQNNIYVGISSCFDNLFELHKYYTEALEALNSRLKCDDSQRIFLYNNALQ